MGGPQSAQPATGNRPAGSEALVLLAGPASAAERALPGYRYKVPKEVTEAIEDSPHFRTGVARLAARLILIDEIDAAGRREAIGAEP